MSSDESTRPGQRPPLASETVSAPDPEVVPRAERRKFSAEYKLRVLAEADACRQPGEIGALLRREGLYSSLLDKWRTQRRQGSLDALAGQKRGPKPDPAAAELARLRHENERLRKRLEQAEAVIEVQKKVSAMLGLLTDQPGESDGRP